MKIVIADYKEPLNRDLEIEKHFFRKGLGDDIEIETYEYNGDVEDLKRAISGADGILTSYLEFPAEVIESNPNLKGISIEATGYNFVDADAAQKQGTAVAVIGEYCTQEVADHTMALALAVSRKLKHYDREIEYKHKYDYNSTSGMKRMEDCTFGIMGLGKIGKAVAKRAKGFGFHIIAYSPSWPEKAAQELGVELVTKEELYKRSDIITLNMRLTPENENILNRDAFEMMEKKPVIVNVSRGQLIDEEALLEALDSGKVFGAGLDVLVEETDENTKKSPFVGREDVILTPHSAFYSDKALFECQRIGAENLVYILKREKEMLVSIDKTLSMNEIHVIEAVSNAGGDNTSKRVAQTLRVSPGTLTASVNTLAAKGYIRKVQSPDDRREYHLEITQKYIDYYNISTAYMTAVMNRISQRFSPEECAKLEDMLTIISRDLMSEVEIPDPPPS